MCSRVDLKRVALSLAMVAAAGNLEPRVAAQGAGRSFTVDQILSLPTPDHLVASPVGLTIGWTFNERGVRNVYAASAPDFQPRRLTSYRDDDGQELTQLAFSGDGKTIVYVRGGDHGANRSDPPPNPAANLIQPKVEVWAVPVAGGAAKLLGEGDSPAIAPDSNRVAFVRNRQIWFARIDGSKPAEAAFYTRGAAESPAWSPDGRTLAFVSNRGDHSFIALYTPDQPIRYIAPSTSHDTLPTWSPDGRRIAFVRQPGTGGTPRSPLTQAPSPWAVIVGDVETPNRVFTAVTSGGTTIDRILQNPGGLGLWWGAGDHLVFTGYRDGWPHLYSISHPTEGGRAALLTPGSFMVEQVTMTPDRRFIVYNANTGRERDDVARRHLFKVPVNEAASVALTSGTGIEWNPAVLGDGQTVAFLTSDAQRPPLPAVVPLAGGGARRIALDHVPADFPSNDSVVPEQVVFRASDGVDAHGQLFKPSAGPARKPAVVYVHGGGPRQMLLGWHYRWEYANDYGANQYLVNGGFVVLSVDYRLSVGYGQAVQFPDRTGTRGASEYLDVLAAGRYLQGRPDVDPRRIGVWGASYGGYLTALALGRNSDVFAAGVDVHGVHDRLPAVNPAQLARAMVGDGLSEAELRRSMKVAFDASPIATVGTWRSPVLLIHGDDDRTVDFHQTVDLQRRLAEKGIDAEELVLPDEVHDSLLWRSWQAAISAMAEFFERKLK